MKRSVRVLLAAVIIMQMVGCSSGSEETRPIDTAFEDSLFGIASNYFVTNQDSALSFSYRQLENLELDSITTGKFHMLIGAVLSEYRLMDSAIHHHQKALSYARNKSLALEMKSYLNIGQSYLTKRNVDSAMVYYNKGYQIARDTNSPTGLYGTVMGMAQIYLFRSEEGQAVKLYRESIQIAKQLKSDPYLFQAYGNFAAMFSHFEKCDSSIFYGHQALAIYKKLGHSDGRDLQIKHTIARCYFLQGELDKARYLVAGILGSSHFKQTAEIQSTAYNLMGDIHLALEQRDEALNYYHQGRKSALEYRNVNHLIRSLQRLEQYHVSEKKDSSHFYLQAWRIMVDSLNLDEAQQRAEELNARYENDINRLTIEKQRAELSSERLWKALYMVISFLLVGAVFFLIKIGEKKNEVIQKEKLLVKAKEKDLVELGGQLDDIMNLKLNRPEFNEGIQKKIFRSTLDVLIVSSGKQLISRKTEVPMFLKKESNGIIRVLRRLIEIEDVEEKQRFHSQYFNGSLRVLEENGLHQFFVKLESDITKINEIKADLQYHIEKHSFYAKREELLDRLNGVYLCAGFREQIAQINLKVLKDLNNSTGERYDEYRIDVIDEFICALFGLQFKKDHIDVLIEENIRTRTVVLDGVNVTLNNKLGLDGKKTDSFCQKTLFDMLTVFRQFWLR